MHSNFCKALPLDELRSTEHSIIFIIVFMFEVRLRFVTNEITQMDWDLLVPLRVSTLTEAFR